MGNNHMSSPDDSCWKTRVTHNASDNAISMKHKSIKPTKCTMRQHCWTTNNIKFQQQTQTMLIRNTLQKNTAQVKLYELLSFTIVREHRFLGSETSIWPRLTASNAVNYHILHVDKTCPPADIRIHVVSCHELLGQLYLIPGYGSLRI